jgi:2-hydroxy-6-oxonona-2,4-dienedioate hydrolase
MNITPEQSISVGGVSTRYRLAGPADAAKVAFLHGGVPGVTPYCSGAHIWGASLDAFLADRRVLVSDLPGSGATGVPSNGPLTVGAMTEHVAALLEALSFRPCHLVGHDIGGLVALSLALDMPARVSSVSIIAGGPCAPSGDMVQNLTLAHPPQPLWTRESQAWALERLSYDHHHIDDAVLDGCVAAAAGAPHRAAAQALAGAAYRKVFVPSIGKAKTRFFEVCRQGGVSVPVQVVWAANDPLTSPDQGLWVFRLIAQRQRATHYHLVNRAGSLLFREQTQQFHQLVAAFQDGVMQRESLQHSLPV